MKAIRPIIVLGLLAGSLAAVQAAAQPADTPRPRPPAASPSSEAKPNLPPGIQRLEIRPDTPEERAAFLARRRAEMERQKIETVPPLPAQRVTSPSGPGPAPQQP